MSRCPVVTLLLCLLLYFLKHLAFNCSVNHPINFALRMNIFINVSVVINLQWSSILDRIRNVMCFFFVFVFSWTLLSIWVLWRRRRCWTVWLAGFQRTTDAISSTDSRRAVWTPNFPAFYKNDSRMAMREEYVLSWIITRDSILCRRINSDSISGEPLLCDLSVGAPYRVDFVVLCNEITHTTAMRIKCCHKVQPEVGLMRNDSPVTVVNVNIIKEFKVLA